MWQLNLVKEKSKLEKSERTLTMKAPNIAHLSI